MPAGSAQRTTGQSLREYGSRFARATGAAGGELAAMVCIASTARLTATPLASASAGVI